MGSAGELNLAFLVGGNTQEGYFVTCELYEVQIYVFIKFYWRTAPRLVALSCTAASAPPGQSRSCGARGA